MKTARAMNREKIARLHGVLRRKGRVLVAFSGGKDSFFLAREAVAAIGKDNVVACCVETPFSGEGARARLDYFRKKIPIPLHRLSLDLLGDERLRRNPRQRCFVCKLRMFSVLKNEAARLGIATVADGSTLSDRSEHRPGRLALAKLGIASPLQDAGITGREIVGELSRSGIEEFYLTSSTCLATRFPYGLRLDPENMRRLGQVEHYLESRGVYPLRVRYIPDGVRLETGAAHFSRVLALKDSLLAFCRDRGFAFVTLDLGGIKSGPWDKYKDVR